MTAKGLSGKRADAQRNRQAILEAAGELLSESSDFPMSEVARRAGVGQATLYRNFPDRADLVGAVVAEEIGHVEQLALEHAGEPDLFFVLLRALAARGRFNALGELARQDLEVGATLDAGRRRIRALMAEPLRQAKIDGSVRRDFALDDVLVVLWMVRGAGAAGADETTRALHAGRALELLMHGLTGPR